ncbi:type II toxin-antitoxin system HicA family toxin [Nocardiopsis suaedae]|uniref:Type II toxin-antitoxin system HicA family toxin n=1 Tax=Nocardiopsis suaedae TaxID=3018444 RepID=A0ABT4TW48_9ACTN|nr:type II toxin-antitoxin system HicA family toxin [Nocardiopsis suaedae]MDA2808915.1 type II toxin-antitoxin system HicA family toxin [Nocardiopsis suaedae]
MSPRAKRLSSKALIKLLEQAGFDPVSTRGDHYKMRRAGRTVVVPSRA